MGILEGSEEGRAEKDSDRVIWVVPLAHGTPTMKLWSFGVRSWGTTQATLLKR